MNGGNDDLRQVVDQMLEDLESRWNASDADSYAEYYSSDADFVDVLGRICRGREAIARIHRENFDTIHVGSRLKLEQVTSRRLNEGVVVAHVRSMLHVPAGPLAGETPATQTLVLQNSDGQWRITAFHNTWVRNMPGIPATDGT